MRTTSGSAAPRPGPPPGRDPGTESTLRPPSDSQVPSALRDDAAAVDEHARARGSTGQAVVAARAGRVVAVVGTGRLGAVAADVLAASGVGTLLLDDAREVRQGDVGVGGLREHHVGRRGDDALSDVITLSRRRSRVGDPRLESPDVVVLVVEEGLEVLRTARLVAEVVPHLVVTVTGWGAVVGPFVLPGETACVRCVELRSGSPDERRDGRAPQAVDGVARAAGGVARGDRVPQAAAVAATAGALVAAEVVAYLDGRRPATAGASIEVEALDAMPRLRGWSVHPRCGCTEMGVMSPGC